MVERSLQLDRVFGSLAHPTRRDILKRAAKRPLSVSEIAKRYDMSLAAISKHLRILEEAKLIEKKRHGKQQFVRLSPAAINDASEFLKSYEKLWNDRLDSLERYLSTFPFSHHGNRNR